MASPVNRHCASCIGTLSFPIIRNVIKVNFLLLYAHYQHRLIEYTELTAG